MNKVVSYIIKIVFFVYVIIQLSINNVQDYTIVVLILIGAAVCTLRERFYISKYMSILEFIVISLEVCINTKFIFLYTVVLFDFIYDKIYLGIVLIFAGTIYFLGYQNVNIFVFYILIGILAYVSKSMKVNKENYKKILDSERRLRYELEGTKIKLLNSAKETARIAEVNERNRIARNIHDNIGHSIAGIYMQLQVVDKLYDKDASKAKEILKKSIEGLSNSLNVLRDTVHNIKLKEELGIQYIVNIIDEFKFCNVEFNYSGNLNLLLPEHMELIAVNIKEALTNASKYSNATKIKISIDITDNYTRTYIKDNGVGIKNLKEGFGISGMRERVRNFGGSLNISAEDGFLIVFIIPHDVRGGKIFENISS